MIPPAIPDHHAGRDIDGRRVEEKPGQWLPAGAAIAIVVRADAELVDRKQPGHAGVNGVDGGSCRGSARDVWLIGDHHQTIAAVLQTRQSASSTPGRISRSSTAGRRIRLAGPHDCPIQHAVAVEEDGARFHRVDSHLVAAALSRGCDTRRCQTTA